MYRIGLSTSQLIVSQFISAINTILLKKFIKWPSTTMMDKFAWNLKIYTKHHTWWGRLMGFHIPIIAPRLHAAD